VLPPPENYYANKYLENLDKQLKLKSEKIFAYKDYSDFRLSYFDKDLV
jgi:hypothetical protein